MKRQKIALTPQHLHAMLDLLPGTEVVHVSAIDDPPAVFVYLSAPEMPENIPDSEAQIIPLGSAQNGWWATDASPTA